MNPKQPKKENLEVYNRINPGLRYIDFPIVLAIGDMKNVPREEDNRATPEEESYWKRYLGIKTNMPKSNYREPSDVSKGNEFVGVFPSMANRIQAIGDTLNTGKIFRNYDKYKKIQPNLPDKSTIEDVYNFGKTLLNNPGTWQEANENMSLKASPKGTTGLGALQHFRLMWDKKKGNINVKDTYDFPIWTRPLIPGREINLQIRDAIKFNPLLGSKMLRNNLKNYKTGGSINWIQKGKYLKGGLIQRYQEGNQIKYNTNELRDFLKSNYNLPLKPNDNYPNIELSNDMFSPSQKAVGDWLKARKSTGRFEQQLGLGNLERQLLNLASSKTFPTRYDYAENKANFVHKKYGEDLIEYYNNTIHDLMDAAGSYNSVTHSQFAEQGPMFNRGTHQRHESTHAANADPQENIIANILTNKKYKMEYWDDPSEIYSRLMQFRLDNNLDPKKVWNIKDIDYLKSLDKNNKTTLFNRYSDDEILRMLNEVAENKQQAPKQYKNVPMAANGGSISGSVGFQYIKPKVSKFQLGGMAFVPGKQQEQVASQTLKGLGEVFSAPQKAMTYAISGKYQTPSEAMDIKNPYAGFVTDMVLDPINLIGGAGILNKGIGRVARKAINKEAIIPASIATLKDPVITTLSASPIKSIPSNLFKVTGKPFDINLFKNLLVKNNFKIAPQTLPEFLTKSELPIKPALSGETFRGVPNASVATHQTLRRPLTKDFFPRSGYFPNSPIFSIVKNSKAPDYVSAFTEINQNNLNSILGKMSKNTGGSFVKKSLFKGEDAFLTKQSQDYEELLPMLTSNLHYKQGLKGIVPQHQSLVIKGQTPNGVDIIENMQVQKYSPGTYLYNSDFSNLNQAAIDEAKRTLEKAANAGLRFDFKGSNNTLWDSSAKRFNFIDTGIEKRFYNELDPLIGFREKLTTGLQWSLPNFSPSTLTPFDWLKSRGLTLAKTGVAAGVGSSITDK